MTNQPTNQPTNHGSFTVTVTTVTITTTTTYARRVVAMQAPAGSPPTHSSAVNECAKYCACKCSNARSTNPVPFTSRSSA